jgi:hypothetical protein
MDTPTGHNITRHGYRTTDFHECIDCGLVMVVSSIEGESRCVLNANVLNIDNYKINNYKINNYISDFSKDSNQERIERRKNKGINSYQVRPPCNLVAHFNLTF